MDAINRSEYEPIADRPLFAPEGANSQNRRTNIVLIFMTCTFVIGTTVSACVPHPTFSNIFLVLCIVMICVSQLTLIFWYRVGDLDPKFKMMIYYNTVSIILLCICANIFFH